MCNIFDIFIAIGGRLNNCCVDSIWGFFSRHADYVLNLEENLDALKNVIGELRALKNDVMRRVEVAELQQMKQLDRVGFWFDRVDAAIDEGDVLLKSGIQEVRRLCLGGYCSVNCWSSSIFGRRVDKCLKQLAALKDKGEQFGAVAEEAAPREFVNELPCHSTIGTEAKFNEVWSCLEEKDVGIIGLYGIGGVGKTTLLTQIHNKFLDTCDNLLVVWVVVGKTSTTEKIQADIGREIGILQGSFDDKRRHIYNKLQKKKFVLLLDDVWEQVKLTEIGIPAREKLNGSKIIFTTRSLKVCGEMFAQKKIKIESLEWKYAWKLFRKYVGEDNVMDDPEIIPLATSVAKRCDGLPIALITTGRAMCCKKEPREWYHAAEILTKLASHLQNSEAEILEGMKVEVFSLLKFSFDSLPNDKVKSCFLHCALFPDDMSIMKDILVHHWICEDIHNDNNHEIKDENEGYSIIGTLVRSCLLEEENNCVKLHDVIRDMALWIGREDTLVMANMELTEAPAVERWEGLRRLSLMHNKIEKLTKVARCPKLVTLLLNRNKALHVINEDFFHFMDALTVLNLSHTSLNKLPRSIISLVSLQYLNISRTDIKEMPVELIQLHKLKYLGLEGLCLKAKRSEKVISYLSSLQILCMTDCIYRYQETDQEGEEVLLISKIPAHGEILLEELLCLKQLNSLRITIRCLFTLESFLRNSNFMSITKSICLKGFHGVKSINICLLANMKYLPELWITKCDFEEMEGTQAIGSLQLRDLSFKTLRKVKLNSCSHLRHLTWLVLVPNLTVLIVYSCQKLEEIINGGKLVEFEEAIRPKNLNPFSKLGLLWVDHLPQLNSIYPNVLPFPCLSKFLVRKCPLLKKLPFDPNSKDGCKIRLRAKRDWWEAIEWEEDATKAALSLRLKFNFF